LTCGCVNVPGESAGRLPRHAIDSAGGTYESTEGTRGCRVHHIGPPVGRFGAGAIGMELQLQRRLHVPSAMLRELRRRLQWRLWLLWWKPDLGLAAAHRSRIHWRRLVGVAMQ